ncbi:peptide-methionine (S)-S-oxide reductase [Bacillus sp. SA1-12]|uniref:peptide-methionine (S)-S-oxide reductase MsrA n=1 Tax=Bacillus sp. SA1-12 TaxID=1455638 RepID=UPI000697AB96|nr:peptide-methionine (S)-S-oxide reductase [Bacillus sp. SA1-12]
MDTVTFGMGCFWGPEARFGSLPGVVKTRVGYAGGKEGQPSSKNTLDFTEVLQIQYDSELLSLDQILTQFFAQHNTARAPRSTKYRSVLFYQNEEQKDKMMQKVEEKKRNNGVIYTAVEPLKQFFEAETRHQKYYLQRWKPVYQKWCKLHSEEDSLVESTLTARLNGLSKGCGKLEEIQREFLDPSLEPLWCVIREGIMDKQEKTGDTCSIEY